MVEKTYSGEFGETMNEPTSQGLRKVSMDDLLDMLGRVTVLDARRGGEIRSSGRKIEGAVHADPEVGGWMDGMVKGGQYVIYGAQGESDEAVRVARAMLGRGFADVLVLDRGFDKWFEAGHPTEAV